MLYRKLSPTQFNLFLDWAEQNKIDHDIWNPEDIVSNRPDAVIEVGIK